MCICQSQSPSSSHPPPPFPLVCLISTSVTLCFNLDSQFIWFMQCDDMPSVFFLHFEDREFVFRAALTCSSHCTWWLLPTLQGPQENKGRGIRLREAFPWGLHQKSLAEDGPALAGWQGWGNPEERETLTCLTQAHSDLVSKLHELINVLLR